ncbi:RNA-directed DNA polymerase, eukaryota, reverse transcriptase zinc-binding domain protein, partial [Tanacetum coccineum]
CESVPSIVLDDDCLNSRDLSKTLLGRIKELASLSNLKKVLKNEGFDEIKLQYMGELWVLLEFPSAKIKELFQENRGAGSWFSVLKQTPIEFIPEGRILWVEIEGVPFKLWSKNTFKKIASKWGEILDTEDQEEDGFYTKRLCIYSKLENNIYENFKVIFRGKVFVLRAKEIPGWVPEFVDELDDDDESVEGSKGDNANSHGAFNFDDARNVNDVTSPKRIVEEEQNEQEWNNANKGSKEEMSGSVCSGLFKKSVAPQSGDNVTVSDFFIIIRGTWLKSGVNILMVAVYAPHDLRDKRILWDYLEYVINRWDGEVIIMGDFNEVRRKSERFGSAFNVQGADMFNTFIENAGLEEIPLGGSSFT